MSKTIVLGASPNPNRFSYKAVVSLQGYGHEVIPIGIRKGSIGELEIVNGIPTVSQIDTITLYLRAEIQKGYYDFILNTQPRRVIFNPGTSNFELIKLLKENDIESIIDCTLVMLNTNNY